MALEAEFRKLLEYELGKTLDTINQNDDFSKIWQCNNPNDFLYGWHMGKVDDFCTNQYFRKYHKHPNDEDKKEIQGILFLHSKDFRDRMSK